MILKSRLASVLAVTAIVVASNSGSALTITPVRCTPDNLPQWNHDLDPSKYDDKTPADGTARGRNAWLFVCMPTLYKTVMTGYRKIGIAAEKDPTANHNNGTITRWYPTFGVITGIDDGANVQFTRPGEWLAPTVAPTVTGSKSCKMPDSYEFLGMCASGCITPDEEIATEQGDVSIANLESSKASKILVPVKTNSGNVFESLKVKRFIKDTSDVNQKVIVVKTLSGGSVRVSINHPLLTRDFTMRRADKLVVGDSLVKADGTPDEIISLEIQDYYGKLHNLTVDTSKLEKSLYIVRGFISGDKKHQDILLSDLNRKALRGLVK